MTLRLEEECGTLLQRCPSKDASVWLSHTVGPGRSHCLFTLFQIQWLDLGSPPGSHCHWGLCIETPILAIPALSLTPKACCISLLLLISVGWLMPHWQGEGWSVGSRPASLSSLCLPTSLGLLWDPTLTSSRMETTPSWRMWSHAPTFPQKTSLCRILINAI